MKPIFSLAAMGCSLPLIEAGGFKWNANKAHDLGGYTPAHETGDLQMQLQPVTAANPEPTSPPELKRSKVQLAERRDSSVPGSVCGYMSHDLDSTLACAFDNTCLFTTFGESWVAGCCPTTSTNCAIATTCVDSSVGESMSYIGISTYWCSSESFPVCVTLSFQDVPGYTIYNCGGSKVITSQSIDHSLDPSDTITSSASTAGASASTDDDDGDIVATVSSDSRSSTKTTTPSTTASPTSSPKPSTPIGAIVGGAVGGVALIVILFLGIFFIVRKGKKKHDPHAYANQAPPIQGQAPPPPHGGAPQMQHAPPPGPMPMPMPMPMHHHQAAPPPFAAAVDNHDRYSIQKAPYDVNTHSMYAPTLSTPGSPPPPHSPGSPGPAVIQGHHQPTPTGSPPPQLQPGQGEGQGFSPADSAFLGTVSQQNTGSTHALHHNEQHSGAFYPHDVHEMSAAGRPDGELRELPADSSR